jgi:two-component system KDP operon response regulator KdpE
MSAEKPVVLVADDEPQIRRLLGITLEARGYETLFAMTGQEALVLAAQHRPDLVILDLGLPDLSGQVILQRLREWTQTPVVILSAQDDEAGKVAALDAGADDYVTKPFRTDELLARLRAALRHAAKGQADDPVFAAGEVVVDLATRRVTRAGQTVHLTATEWDLLRLFIRHAGKVLTHHHILETVWGKNHVEHTHYLRVYVTRLRDKLEADPGRPQLILTETSVGYRLAGG